MGFRCRQERKRSCVDVKAKSQPLRPPCRRVSRDETKGETRAERQKQTASPFRPLKGKPGLKDKSKRPEIVEFGFKTVYGF